MHGTESTRLSKLISGSGGCRFSSDPTTAATVARTSVRHIPTFETLSQSHSNPNTHTHTRTDLWTNGRPNVCPRDGTHAPLFALHPFAQVVRSVTGRSPYANRMLCAKFSHPHGLRHQSRTVHYKYGPADSTSSSLSVDSGNECTRKTQSVRTSSVPAPPNRFVTESVHATAASPPYQTTRTRLLLRD